MRCDLYSNLTYDAPLDIAGYGDIGFVNFAERDLHPTDSAEAVTTVTGLSDFPAVNFEGKPRTASHLDAGVFTH